MAGYFWSASYNHIESSQQHLKYFITIPLSIDEETKDQKGFINLSEVTWLTVIGFQHSCEACSAFLKRRGGGEGGGASEVTLAVCGKTQGQGPWRSDGCLARSICPRFWKTPWLLICSKGLAHISHTNDQRLL